MTEYTMSKEELLEAAEKISGGDIQNLALEQVFRLMTITQFVTDLCLNEVERRGELGYAPTGEGLVPIIPYHCHYAIKTVLTRTN
jgi:hypothetical protein